MESPQKDESRQLLEELAINELECFKNNLEEKYPNFINDIEGYSTPSELETIKSILEKTPRATEGSRVPKGKVNAQAPNQGNEQSFESIQQEIDAIYNNLEELKFKQMVGQPFDAERLQTLQAMSDKLLTSALLEGDAKNRRRISHFDSVQTCFKCGKTMINGVCESCGFKDRGLSSDKSNIVIGGMR